MFKRKAITDERIVNAQNKIYRELYSIIMVICIISIVVKSAVGTREHTFVEIAILSTGVVYYLIRAARMGIYSEEAELKSKNSKWNADKQSLLYSGGLGIFIGIVLGVILGLNSALNYADDTAQAVTYFFLVFAVTIMMYAPFLFFVVFVPHMLAKKKSEQVNRRMLEELEEDKE